MLLLLLLHFYSLWLLYISALHSHQLTLKRLDDALYVGAGTLSILITSVSGFRARKITFTSKGITSN